MLVYVPMTIPVDIPVCYWTKLNSSSIAYRTDTGVTGLLPGYCLGDIQQNLGPDYIYSYIPAEAWT